MQKSYFQMTLEKTIRQTEKLLKILQAVQTDYADKRMEAAMEKAVSAAKQAEAVALLTRALPAHTGHPRAKELTRNAIAEAIPIEIGFTDQGWLPDWLVPSSIRVEPMPYTTTGIRC